jgi:hypothetical protein
LLNNGQLKGSAFFIDGNQMNSLFNMGALVSGNRITHPPHPTPKILPLNPFRYQFVPQTFWQWLRPR